MKKNFINHTNHPSARWSAEQISAAQAYGEILDVAFPAVQKNLEKILAREPAVVLCQGEFNYTFAMVECLKASGVKVVAATSERATVEEILSDGSTRQISIFRFVQFKEY